MSDGAGDADGDDAAYEAARVGALRELAVLDTPHEERFDRVTRLASHLFGVPMALVTLIDADRQWVKSRVGTDLEETERRDAFCRYTIGQDDLFVVPDASADERFSTNRLVVGDPNIRFYAGKALHAKSGHRIGALCLLDDKPRQLAASDQALLEDLASWVEKELVVEEELERAGQVQQQLLPRATVALDGYQVAGACVPTASVAGDFFDWYRAPGGMVLTVADVMGKGMSSAILMATVRAVLRGTTKVAGLSEAVAQAAVALEEDLHETTSFVTAFHASLDAERGTVRYVDAGHGLAFVTDARGVHRRLRSGGLPIGVDGGEWAEHEDELAPGDALVVVSDGVLDAFGVVTRSAEIDAVLARVAKLVVDSPSASDAVAAVVADVGAQPDDVTVVVLRRCA